MVRLTWADIGYWCVNPSIFLKKRGAACAPFFIFHLTDKSIAASSRPAYAIPGRINTHAASTHYPCGFPAYRLCKAHRYCVTGRVPFIFQRDASPAHCTGRRKCSRSSKKNTSEEVFLSLCISTTGMQHPDVERIASKPYSLPQD